MPDGPGRYVTSPMHSFALLICSVGNSTRASMFGAWRRPALSRQESVVTCTTLPRPNRLAVSHVAVIFAISWPTLPEVAAIVTFRRWRETDESGVTEGDLNRLFVRRKLSEVQFEVCDALGRDRDSRRENSCVMMVCFLSGDWLGARVAAGTSLARLLRAQRI